MISNDLRVAIKLSPSPSSCSEVRKRLLEERLRLTQEDLIWLARREDVDPEFILKFFPITSTELLETLRAMLGRKGESLRSLRVENPWDQGLGSVATNSLERSSIFFDSNSYYFLAKDTICFSQTYQCWYLTLLPSLGLGEKRKEFLMLGRLYEKYKAVRVPRDEVISIDYREGFYREASIVYLSPGYSDYRFQWLGSIGIWRGVKPL